LLLLAASASLAPLYCWAGLVMGGMGFLLAKELPPANLMTVAVVLFCTWLLFNAEFLTASYVAAGTYRPLILLCGFVAVASLSRAESVNLFRIIAAVTVLLVLLGFVQSFLGISNTANGFRASGTFTTPNTFATVINLMLLPMLALALSAKRNWLVYLTGFCLFAGLVTTESRGGYLAFAAGCVFLVLYRGLPKTRAGWLLTGAIGLTSVIFAVVIFAVLIITRVQEAGAFFGSTVISRGLSFRPELASIAVEHLLDRPVLGVGAGMFPAIYQMSKPPALDSAVHYNYVHNDYLQIWLEFGLVGIVLLVLVVCAAGYALLQSRRRDPADPYPAAIGAALASLFAHAAVEYPLYVPFPLLLTGAFLGALAVHAGEARWLAKKWRAATSALQPYARQVSVGAVVLILGWTALPAAAAILSDQALRELTAARMKQGMEFQVIARFLEPRNPMHYWAEAVMWRELAADSRSPGLADKADALFARGIAVSPYEAIIMSIAQGCIGSMLRSSPARRRRRKCSAGPAKR
jgi:O-antigen ligase